MKYIPKPDHDVETEKGHQDRRPVRRAVFCRGRSLRIQVIMRQPGEHPRNRHMHLHRLRVGIRHPRTVRSPIPVVKWPSIAASLAGWYFATICAFE